MSDRDALMFAFGVCVTVALYQAIDCITEMLHDLRKPRVEWHVFGPDASSKDAAPMPADMGGVASAPAGTSGHIKATRP